MSNTNRRDFLGYTFAAVAAVGGAASLVGMKQAWDPLPSVLEGGFTNVETSGLKLVNQLQLCGEVSQYLFLRNLIQWKTVQEI